MSKDGVQSSGTEVKESTLYNSFTPDTSCTEESGMHAERTWDATDANSSEAGEGHSSVGMATTAYTGTRQTGSPLVQLIRARREVSPDPPSTKITGERASPPIDSIESQNRYRSVSIHRSTNTKAEISRRILIMMIYR